MVKKYSEMTEEERIKQKEYNAQYFKDHRSDIIEKMNKPVICEHCAKTVRRHQLSKHHKTLFCMKHQNLNQVQKMNIKTVFTIEISPDGTVSIVPKE